MSSIESALARLDEFIERQLPTLNAPGLAVGLTHRDSTLYTGAYRLANQETRQPVTPQTLFQIGSISKSFTSIILLQLQEQGVLSLHDPVTKHLPWFEIQSAYAPVTLRHLMSHTAGIICGSDETVSAYTETWNLRHTRATAPPGEMFHYSNTGYKVLGVVLETVLGQAIGEILYERILEPLGMTSTLPVISSAARPKLAVGYSPFYDDRPLPPGGLLAPATWIESDTADGSICSSAEDMCKYLRALLQKGTGLLPQKGFEQLVEALIPVDSETHPKYYGLGLSSEQLDGSQVIGHSGGMVGYSADMLADLDNGMGVIVLCNGPARLENLSRSILRLFRTARRGDGSPEMLPDIQGIIEEADEREATSGGERNIRAGTQGESSIAGRAAWDVYTGHYRSHNPWLSNFRIVFRKASLLLIDPSGDEQPLHQTGPGLFRVGDDPRSPEFIRFDVVIDGKAMQAILSGGVYSRTFTL